MVEANFLYKMRSGYTVCNEHAVVPEAAAESDKCSAGVEHADEDVNDPYKLKIEEKKIIEVSVTFPLNHFTAVLTHVIRTVMTTKSLRS